MIVTVRRYNTITPVRKYHKQAKLVERFPKKDLQREGLTMSELLDLHFPMPQIAPSNSGSSAKAVSSPVDIPQLTLHMIWTHICEDNYNNIDPFFYNIEAESYPIAEAEPPSPSNVGVVGSDPGESPPSQATSNSPVELSSPVPIPDDSEPDLPTAPVAINRKVSENQKRNKEIIF